MEKTANGNLYQLGAVGYALVVLGLAFAIIAFMI